MDEHFCSAPFLEAGVVQLKVHTTSANIPAVLASLTFLPVCPGAYPDLEKSIDRSKCWCRQDRLVDPALCSGISCLLDSYTVLDILVHIDGVFITFKFFT